MINLLPYDKKRDLRASRNNTAMIKCLLTLGASAIFLAVACTATMFFLNNSKEINDNLSQNVKLSAETVSINQNAATARANLSTSQKILASQILYSKLLTLTAQAIPAGVVLDSINIDNSTINTPVTLSLHATTTDKIDQIAKNFQASPAFSSYNFVSAKQDASNSTYPTKITVKVKINKGNINGNQ